MSLGTFINTDVEAALTAADATDMIGTLVSEEMGPRVAKLYAKFDAALIKFGEAERTDLSTTMVTFSTGGKAVLTQLASATPLVWASEAPFLRNAQVVLDALLAAVDGASSGAFTPATTPSYADPDYSTMSDKIISKANEITTAAAAVLRDEIAAALEEFDASCSPARVDNDWTFATLPKSILLVAAGATPTVLPTALFEAEYARKKAEFEALALVGRAKTGDAPA